jgi:3-aminobutyryl-CoA ammonia-lyase
MTHPEESWQQPRAVEGDVVRHRRYVPRSHAHYAGDLVDGAYGLGLFGDAATEMCMRSDGDEGLFASYSDVQFRAPVHAGDLVEVTAELTRVGNRSRTMRFTLHVVGRGRPELGTTAAQLLAEPVVATTAIGVVIVPIRVSRATRRRR